MILLEQLQRDGFTTVSSLIDKTKCCEIAEYIEQSLHIHSYGIRSILSKTPFLQELLEINSIKTIISDTFGQNYIITRSIYFNKSLEKNWLVPWHRDKVISVKHKLQLDGFSGNQKRQDHWHVNPPRSILQEKLTLRIHLDNCTTNNGALHVIPTSHQDENISDNFKTDRPSKAIEMEKGDGFIFRPLLLHSSKKTNNGKPRRVIHLEFSPKSQNDTINYFENRIKTNLKTPIKRVVTNRWNGNAPPWGASHSAQLSVSCIKIKNQPV